MKEAQGRKVRRHEEVIKRILQNASQMEKAKAFKKAVASEIPEAKRDLIREGAERLISDLKKICRNGSLIDVLEMVARKVRGKEYSPIVLKVLIERIKRNQWNRLSTDQKILVCKTEASLEEQTV
ncbi:MAG: hypothetical protein NTW46_00670 [Candidatus Nealsonbacteria bacterium]|nr:hypothetical protein [Candidatus Nealsonbacteria bacterium]